MWNTWSVKKQYTNCVGNWSSNPYPLDNYALYLKTWNRIFSSAFRVDSGRRRCRRHQTMLPLLANARKRSESTVRTENDNTIYTHQLIMISSSTVKMEQIQFTNRNDFCRILLYLSIYPFIHLCAHIYVNPVYVALAATATALSILSGHIVIMYTTKAHSLP